MRAVSAVSAVWAVRAVRVAGVGHGLEPVKHCFAWQGRWRGGASASGGGGEGSAGGWAVRAAGGWADWSPLFMAGALEGVGGKCERWGR